MSAFDFPSNPSNGQSYSANGITFVWNGTAWKRQTGATKGIKGEPGTSGPTGPQGPQGPAGATGPQGPPGPSGGQGSQGQKGDTGAQGTQGPPGPSGGQGSQGSQGQKGDTGAQGTQGPTGPQGNTGPQGQKGDMGGGAPVGQIIAWSGAYNSLPSGYLICDGSAISRTTYAALFAVVGTTHGSGDGSTTFNLPDLQSKFITGASSDPNNSGYSVGAEGGENFVTLTVNQMPAHTHSQQGGGTHDDGGPRVTGSTSDSTITNINSAGGGQAHENRPPYYALAYIIQYAQGGDVAKGQKGAAGPTGPQGPQGPQGSQGQKGESASLKGDKGDTGGAPVGQVVAWSGNTSSLPTGYLLCDGSAVSRSTYAPLFAVVGTTHGAGDGSSTFNLPDLRDKFVLGASNSTGDTTYPGVSPGATGGQADAIVPDHTHPTTFDGKKYFPGGGSTNIGYGGAGSYPADTFSMSNPTNGESVTNKNLPPYYALAYIIQFAQGGDVAKGQKGEQSTVPGPAGPQGQKGEASTVKGDKGDTGGGAPVGQIIAWSGSTSSLPTGYFLCDGSAISRTTYAALFTVVGTTHGNGDGSSTFNLPDLRDRFVVGGGSSYSVGATGGSASGTTSTDSQAANGSSYDGATIGNQNRHTHTYDNLPPYYSLAYIIQYSQGGDVAKGQKGEAGTSPTLNVKQIREAASTAQSGTGQSYTDKVTLTMTVENNSRVMIISSYELQSSTPFGSGNNTMAKTIKVGGSFVGEEVVNAHNGYYSYTGSKKYDIFYDTANGAGSRSYKIQWKRLTNGTGYIRNARLLGIELGIGP